MGVVTEMAARSESDEPGSSAGGGGGGAAEAEGGAAAAGHPALGPIGEGLRLENYRARLRAAESALVQREIALQQRASLAGFSGLDDPALLGGGGGGDLCGGAEALPPPERRPSDTGSQISQPPDYEG